MASGKKFYKRPIFITLIIALLIAAVAVPTALALTERQAKKLDVQAEVEEVWGEAVEGVQVRLRAKGATTAKWVTLLADARNDGPGTYRGTRSTHGCWLKVDGKWYGRVQTREFVAPMLLKAGDRQLAFTQIRLGSEKSHLWRGGFITRNGQVPSLGAREIHQAEPLELSPGRHTVRLAFPASRKAYAYSNTVEIEILPAEEKPAVQVEREGFSQKDEDEQGNAYLDAIIGGDLRTVQKLLANDLSLISMIDNNRGKDSSGLPALHLAIKYGHSGIVELLLSKGAKADEKNVWGYGSLVVAARNGRANMVKLLVEHGADVNGEKNKFRRSPLFNASNAQVAEALIFNGAGVNWRDERRATALHSIARNGETAIAEVLLAHGAGINAKDSADRTPLHVAAGRGQKDMVELLVTKGADIDTRDKRGSTPLHLAVTAEPTVPKAGRKATARFLLARGADFTIHDVAWIGDAARVRKLLESNPYLARNADKALFAAILEGHSTIVELLLDNGAKLSTKGRFKEPLLHAAAYSGHRDMAALLLRKGAIVNRKGAHGELALHWAAAKGHGEIARLLVEGGAEVNTHTDTTRADVDELPAGDHADVIHEWLRYLSDCKKQEQAEAEGSSLQIMGPLRLAFSSGDTPLHSAAQWGHKEIVELLLSNGAEVNAANKWGQTPLHYAVVFQHDGVVKALLDAGANPDVRTQDGPNAHDLASIVKNTGLADMLGMKHNMIGPAGEIEDKSKITELLTVIEDERYADIRQGIMLMVDDIGDKEPISFLYEQLKSRDRERRSNAALALQILGETPCVEGLCHNLELIKNKLAFGEGAELVFSLTNTTAEPIDVVGYARNSRSDKYLLPCAQLTISKVGSKYYGVSSYDIGTKPKAIRIAPGKSWSFRIPPSKMKESNTSGEHRSSLPSLSALPPGKYTARLTYFIRESEIEKFGPGLVFGTQMGSLAGKKPDRIWQGIIMSNEIVFEVLDDDSEQLRIRKAIDNGEGLENVEFELKASKTKALLSVFAKNTGEKILYLGGHYCLRGKNPMGKDRYFGIFGSGPMELKPGVTLELGGWNLRTIGPGTYWVEYLANFQPELVLKKSNTVTFEVPKPAAPVEIDDGKEVPADRLIVPGRGVGDYKFGMSKDDVLKSLKKTKGDSIREAGNSISLDGIILNTTDDSVKSIDVLSPLYRFANGLGIGSSEQQIIQAFGNDFHLKEYEGKDFLTYEDKGLVFEIYKYKRTVMEISVLNIADSLNQSRKTAVQVEAEEEVSKLVERLKSENRRERCQAALKLESLGDRRGVPAIIKELKDTSYRPTDRNKSDGREDQEGQVRQDHYYAALLLGILGDKRAVPALIEATRDETIDYQAAMSLGQIGDKRAIPALHDMLDRCSNKPFPRLFAGYGLAMLGEKEGLKVVIDTLNNQQVNWTNRRHAIEALSKLRDKEAVPYLIAALKDEHPNIRVSAAKALGAIGDLSALPALKQALEDKTETKVNAPTTVSEAAAKAIAQIEGCGSAVEGEEGWGQAIEGVQVRLRLAKTVWESGKVPTFHADVRNNGEREIVLPISEHGWRLEFDGEWYESRTRVIVGLRKLPQGEECCGIKFSLGSWWLRTKNLRERIQLKPGKHTVRVSCYAKRDSGSGIRANSNPVEIEILPAEEKPAVQVEMGALSFGSVVECVLSEQSMHYSIDLDTGKTAEQAAKPGRTGLEGMDAHVVIKDDKRGLQFHEVFAGYQRGIAAEKTWEEKTAQELSKSLHDATWGIMRMPIRDHFPWEEMSKRYLTVEDKLPMTLVFMTRHGTKGLLQLTEFTNNPKGVKIRYKLIKQIDNDRKSDVQAEAEEMEKTDSLVWGKEVNGLRAAVEFVPEKESYDLEERVGVRFHIQNVSNEDVQFSSLSGSRKGQYWPTVKDSDGKEVKVDTWESLGTWSKLHHIIKPGQILTLKNTGLIFSDFHDSALLDKPKWVGIAGVVRCGPGQYSIYYKLSPTLKTGVRKVTVNERPPVNPRSFELTLDQQSMLQAIQTLRRKYRVRICLEQVGSESASRQHLLTGTFFAPTIPELLDKLTETSLYKWEKFYRTYAVYPKRNSLLRFSVKTDISESPLESVARVILGQDPSGEQIEIEAVYKGRMRTHLWISRASAMYALSGATARAGISNSDVVWTLTLNQGVPRLYLHRLSQALQTNEQIQADMPDEKDQLVWGEAAEGLAVRLRPKGATTAKRVTLLADARNDGPGTYRGTRSTHGCWLKVDGKWYGRVNTRERVAPMLLKAGDRQLAFTQIRLSSEKNHLWCGGISTNDGLVPPPLTVTVKRNQSDKQLELTPGRHSVRLALPTNKREGKTYAYSNPVEIEILPKEKPAEHVDMKKVWDQEINALRAVVESTAGRYLPADSFY